MSMLLLSDAGFYIEEIVLEQQSGEQRLQHVISMMKHNEVIILTLQRESTLPYRAGAFAKLLK